MLIKVALIIKNLRALIRLNMLLPWLRLKGDGAAVVEKGENSESLNLT
jgi:hypothetical protein